LGYSPRAIQAVDVEHVPAIANRDVHGLLSETEQVLEVGARDIPQLTARMLAEFPQAQADLVATVLIPLERTPFFELAEQSVSGATGQAAFVANFAERARGWAEFKNREDAQDACGHALAWRSDAASHSVYLLADVPCFSLGISPDERFFRAPSARIGAGGFRREP
jgi:hypothetical protein